MSKMPESIVLSHNNQTEDPTSESWQLIPWFYKESPEFYDWIRQTYYLHQIGQVLTLFVLGQVFGCGWSFVVWGFVIRLLLGIHGVSAVNSFAHVWGEKPFKTGAAIHGGCHMTANLIDWLMGLARWWIHGIFGQTRSVSKVKFHWHLLLSKGWDDGTATLYPSWNVWNHLVVSSTWSIKCSI